MGTYDNFKTWFTIAKDGSMSKKIMLSLEDKKRREEIIAGHFRAFYKGIYGVDLPSLLVERDNPHDFTFKSDSGEKLYLEIISISNSNAGFKKQSNELKLNKLLEKIGMSNSTIAILPQNTTSKELKGLVSNVDSYPLLQIKSKKDLEKLFKEVLSIKKPVLRKLRDKKRKRITLVDGEAIPPKQIVRKAILEKAKKGYKNIGNMVLVIDDQIIEHGREDIERSMPLIIRKNQNNPFKEIFVYSGFCSNRNGLSAEFVFYPAKSQLDPKIKHILD